MQESSTVPRSQLAAVFLVAFAVLTYEVALTRVFSVVLHHHYVFLAISGAICGLGLGGLALHQWRLRAGRAARASSATPAASALAFALTSFGVLALLLLWVFPHHLDKYWIAGALLLVPFSCAGVFMADVFSRHGAHAGRVYAADLLGAALAAVLVIGGLYLFGGINACILASVLAAGAALACGGGRRVRLAAALVTVALSAGFAGNLATGFLEVGAVRPGYGGAIGDTAKPLFSNLEADPATWPVILESRWNAFARTDLVDNPGFGEHRENIYQLFTNGHVPTYMLRVDGDLRNLRVDEYIDRIPAIGHLASNALLAFNLKHAPRVLCIGPGGGEDVLGALIYSGAEAVEGAELNGSIMALMRDHADYNGHLYELPNVNVVTAEGRSFLRRSRKQYNLIYSALTQSSSSAGAAALMENYVYTREAFQDYWDHLSPDGVLAFIVHEQRLLVRLFATGVDLLGRQGKSEVAATEHLALFEDPSQYYSYQFLFLLSKAPLSEGLKDAMFELAQPLELQPLFVPGRVDGQFAPLRAGQTSLEQLLAQSRVVNPDTGKASAMILDATSDDQPFFFDTEPGLPEGLGGLCLGAAILVILFTLVAWIGRRGGAIDAGAITPFALYFAGLGCGFMLIEIPLIQKLVLTLGYPALAMTVTLFALLLGGGLGSWVSQRRWDDARLPRTILFGALGAALISVLLVLLLPSIDAALLHLPLILRVLVVALGLGLLGFCLGIPFPSGLRLLSRMSAAEVPWMWGINGILSVVGSLLAVIGANLLGFRAVLLCGAGVYVLVALLGLVMGRVSARTAAG